MYRKTNHQVNQPVLSAFLVLMILTIISCSCLPSNKEGNEGVVGEVKQTEEEIATQTKPAATKTATLEPAITSTVTIDAAAAATTLAEILADYGQPALRPWSAPAYPDATFITDDRDQDPEWDEVVEKHVRNLAIESPYYYEFYEVPSGLRFADIREYFNTELPALGYKTGTDLQGTNEIYLLSFLNDSVKPVRKIVLQYWRSYDMIMLIYQNPE